MSEELTIQEGNSQEDVTIERTIEVSIDKNGLGIESGQVFPSVTVDFAPVIAPASVRWGDIIDKPDPVTGVFYNQREADFEYETFDGQGEVIISRERLKEILNIPTNAVKVYSYDVNFDDLKVGDVVISLGGKACIVRERDGFMLELCSYDYRTVISSYFEKNEGVWECVYETETPIRLEESEVGNFVSIDENGNISDSGSKASDFIAYIGYNPRESDFIYRKGDENGTDEVIISKENLKGLILSDVESFTMFDDNGDAWEIKISTSGELVTERKQYT